MRRFSRFFAVFCVIFTLFHNFYSVQKTKATKKVTKSGDQGLFTPRFCHQLHDVLIARLSKDMYSKDFYLNSSISRIIRFLQHKNDTELKAWFEVLASDNHLLELMDNLVNIGYGESNTRFRIYAFSHSLFDNYVNLEQVEKEVRLFLEQGKNIEAKRMLSKILFLMPRREDNPYSLGEILAFCKEQNILFSYKDEFVDE